MKIIIIWWPIRKGRKTNNPIIIKINNLYLSMKMNPLLKDFLVINTNSFLSLGGFLLELQSFAILSDQKCNLLWLCRGCPYLEIRVGVGVRQPGRAGVLLVLEGPLKNLRYGTEIEGTHRRRSDAVSVKNTGGYKLKKKTHTKQKQITIAS